MAPNKVRMWDPSPVDLPEILVVAQMSLSWSSKTSVGIAHMPLIVSPVIIG